MAGALLLRALGRKAGQPQPDQVACRGLWEGAMGGTQRSLKVDTRKKIPIDTLLFLESVTQLNLNFHTHQYSGMAACVDPADYRMLTSVPSYLNWGRSCWGPVVGLLGVRYPASVGALVSRRIVSPQ